MTDDDGWSALHLVAERGNIELFQYLLEKCCNVYIEKRDGRNDLHAAAWNGHLRFWKVLLENYSFNIQMTDDDGWSAPQFAAE